MTGGRGFGWISAHIGLLGNEKTDWWAKRSLIYNIISPSPISPRTFKSKTVKCINEFWQEEWNRLQCEDKYRENIE